MYILAMPSLMSTEILNENLCSIFIVTDPLLKEQNSSNLFEYCPFY